MNRVLYLVLVVAACREKHVPYTPPAPEDAKTVSIDAPVVVDAAIAEKPRATKVAVGEHFTCAVLADATARCWGKNSNGQLGNGTTTNSPTPVKVPIPGVIDIVAGIAHACVLLDDSSVACWGHINVGAKGNLTKPTAALGVQGAKRIFAVGGASCASLTDGSLVCWGDIDAKGHPRVWTGTPANRPPMPLADVDRVIAMTQHGVLREDGTAPWFGDKVTLEGIVEIASEGTGLCGLRRDGTVVCTGPRHCAWTKKTPVPAIEELALPTAKHLAFDAGTCVVTTTGKVQCLDPSDGCKAEAPWTGITDAEIVSANCARTKTNGLRCWQRGAKSRKVTAVAGVARVETLAGSVSHVCVSSAGEIICLGSNKFGALGRGEETDRLHADAKAVAF